MRAAATAHPGAGPRPVRFEGFGPIGSVVVTFALALGAFCLTLFLSIFALLAWNTLGHHHADYALSYRYIALPAALATGFASAAVLAALAIRRRTGA